MNKFVIPFLPFDEQAAGMVEIGTSVNAQNGNDGLNKADFLVRQDTESYTIAQTHIYKPPSPSQVIYISGI